MLTTLHSAITNLLYGPGQLPAEVELAFEAPGRDWLDARIAPVICLFLFDIQENTDLRQASMQTLRGADGWATQRMPPRRFDLHYMVAAISTVTADEHLLLWRTLATLLRYTPLPVASMPGSLVSALLRRDHALPAETAAALAPHLAADQPLPPELLARPGAELDEYIVPVTTRVGRPADGPRAGELWSAFELPPRPSIFYSVTLPLDLEIAFSAPLVLSGPTRRLLRPAAEDFATGFGGPGPAVAAGTVYSIGGVVRDRQVEVLAYPQVRANEAYLSILLLSRVVVRLGSMAAVSPAVVEGLFATDFVYLQELYARVNAVTPSLVQTRCPTCGTRFALDLGELNGQP